MSADPDQWPVADYMIINRWRTFDQMAGSHLYNRIQAHEAAGATGHT